MSELLKLAISLSAWLRYAELKKLPDTQQNEVALMILQQIRSDKLSSLWQKIDELDIDEEQPTMEEITTMVKEVRHNSNKT